MKVYTEAQKLTEQQSKIVEDFIKNLFEEGLTVELIGTRPNDR